MRIANNIKAWERKLEQELLDVLLLLGASEAPENWDGIGDKRPEHDGNASADSSGDVPSQH